MENNYISTVLNKITNEKVKNDIQAELEDHYNERVEYYTRIGYDKETAEEKANAHFGDEAELIGEQLDSINVKSVAATVIFAFVSAIFMFGILLLNFIWSDFGGSFSSSYVGIFILFLYLPVCLTEIAVGLKNKSSLQSAFGFIGIIELAIVFKGFGSVLFCIHKLIRGEGGRLLDLLWNFNWQSTSGVINVLGILFCIFCVGLHLYATYLIARFERCEYKKRHIRQEKAVKITAAVIAVLTLLLLVAVIVTPTKYSGRYVPISEIYVIESDEMVDPAEIEDYDQHSLEIDFESSYPRLRESFDSFVDSNLFNAYINDFDDDDDVVYNTYIIYAEFQPTKKYVCVVSVTGIGHTPKFSESEWYDTSTETFVESDFYNSSGSIVQYKVKILPLKNAVEE